MYKVIGMDKCQYCGTRLTLNNTHKYVIKEGDKVISIGLRCNKARCLETVPKYYEKYLP